MMYTLNTAEETTPTNKTYQTGNLIPLNFSTNKFKNNPDFDQKLFYFYAICYLLLFRQYTHWNCLIISELAYFTGRVAKFNLKPN